MALYKCKDCGEYLTEMDVEFINNLKKKEHVEGKCCKCIMGAKQISLAERNIKKEYKKALMPGIRPLLIYLLVFVIGLLIGILKGVLLWISIGISIFPICYLCSSIFKAKQVVKNYNNDIKKYCNPELIETYRRVFTKRFEKDLINEDEYNIRRKMYKESLDAVYAKYNCEGDEILNQKLSQVFFFPHQVIINEKKYYVISIEKKWRKIHYYGVQDKHYYAGQEFLQWGQKERHVVEREGILLCYMDQNKKAQMKILYEGRILYTNENDWIETWKDLGYEAEAIKWAIKK